MTETQLSDLEMAFEVLAKLVRGEFPADYSLQEIAETWGDVSPGAAAALGRVERRLAPVSND